MLDVALAAGFGSLRRFTDVFKRHYHLSPTALRKRMSEEKGTDGDITLALGYRPPYPWENMLKFLAGRAIAGVDMIKNNTYMRTAHFITTGGKHSYGWVRVGHKARKNVLTVTVSESLLPVLPQVLARVRRLFDLHCDPDAVYEILQSMNTIRPGLCVLGTRIPGCFDAFEMAVRAVLGQQITVKAASTLAARLELHLGSLGVTAARAKTIHELARSLAEGEISFDLCAQPEETIKKLMTIRGIGSWTAQYIAMRALAWPDAFLETDAGVKKALPPCTSKERMKLAEAWRPWRSYATVNLWNSR